MKRDFPPPPPTPKDSLESNYPDVIDTTLDYGLSTVCAFNRRGTLLAAGTKTGDIVIWDFESYSVAKVLEVVEGSHVTALTTLSFSRNGKYLLSGCTAGLVIRWDVLKGEMLEKWEAPAKDQSVMDRKNNLPKRPIADARMHPKDPTVWLISTGSDCPVLVKHQPRTLRTPPQAAASDASTAVTDPATYEEIPVRLPESSKNVYKGPQPKKVKGQGLGGEHEEREAPVAEANTVEKDENIIAIFNKRGTAIYAGSEKGYLTVYEWDTLEVQESFLTIRARVKEIVFSRDEKLLNVNTSKGGLRIYDNETFEFLREFQDVVNRVQWRRSCFSGSGEYVVGGAAIKDKQHIYVWERNFGQLVKILEGPNQALSSLTYHPLQPLLAAVGSSGLIFVWHKNYQENWSAFATDFVELEDNEEYIEREDEFDVDPLAKKEAVEEEEKELDIVTPSTAKVFSDDDDDELVRLPTIPKTTWRDPDDPGEVLDDTQQAKRPAEDMLAELQPPTKKADRPPKAIYKV